MFVLQARPITALPARPTAELNGLGWEKDVAHVPELVTPFGWSLFGSSAEAAGAAMGSDYGLMLAGMDGVSIGGEIYMRPVPPFGSPEPRGRVPPAILVGLVARLVPALRTRMATAKHALTSGLPERVLDRWKKDWRSEFQRRTRDLLAIDLGDLDDAAMVNHLSQARALLEDGHHVHFQLLIPYALALYDLVAATEQLLAWDASETMELLVGSSPGSVAGARALTGLRGQIASRPELFEAIHALPADPIAALRLVDDAVADELESWFQTYAWRTTNYDPGSPVIAERPGVVTRLLLHAEDRSDKDAASDAEARALAVLDRRSDADRDRFITALAAARRAYPVREDNVTLTDNIPCGILRRWVLEAGRRLAQGGDLARADDAVFCRADELASSLGGNPSPDLAAHVARRRGEQAWVRAHPGPAIVGTPDEIPDLRFLPKQGRRINEAMLWMLRMEFPGEAPHIDDATLTGVPASAGTYTGPVHRVMSEHDFGAFLPGEVMVCPTASPSWTVLFATAGALVADGGGVLAHAAIVAREHGLPAVVGTVQGTKLLANGQIVTVDGTAGIVTISD